MTGRPCLLDDLRAKRICDAIAAGNTRRCAAALAGVSTATLHDWLARGRVGEAPFSDFLDRVKKADAKAEAAAVKVVFGAASAGTWQAAAWFLERRHRAWRRRADAPPHVANHDLEKEIVTKMSHDELDYFIEHAQLPPGLQPSDIAARPTRPR